MMDSSHLQAESKPCPLSLAFLSVVPFRAPYSPMHRTQDLLASHLPVLSVFPPALLQHSTLNKYSVSDVVLLQGPT
jgi:hypothetical protein